MSDTTPTPPAPNSDRPAEVHGHVDDPAGMAEGDFGLDGNLTNIMVEALEKAWNKDDPGATELPDDAPDVDASTPPADTAATPAPASSPPLGSDTGDGSGAGGGGDAAGEGAAPEQAAPPVPAPTDSELFSLDQYAQDYFGTKLDASQARELFGLLGGLQNLTPEKRAQLDAVLAGGQPGQYPATTGMPVNRSGEYQATQPVAPAEQLPAGLPPRPDDEFEAQLWDRYMAPLARAQEERYAAIQADIARTTQTQLEQQQRALDAEIAAASAEWKAAHPILKDGEYDALVDRIVQEGTFGALVQAHGSAAAATKVALDQHFWANESLRQRALANAASGRDPLDPTVQDPTSPIAQDAAEVERQRQARAAAVSGGGGIAAPPGGQIPKPRNAEERKKAMTAEIAADPAFAQ